MGIEQADIGEVKFYNKSWGRGSSRGINFTELEVRPCLDQDFNFSHDEQEHDKDPIFFPVTEDSKRDLNFYSKKLKCLVEEEEEDGFGLRGSYNSDNGTNLMIVFERCRSDNKHGIECKNDTVIDEWLENKYLVTLEN